MKIKSIISFLMAYSLLLLLSSTMLASPCPPPDCGDCYTWVSTGPGPLDGYCDWDCSAGQICCNGTCCDSSDCCSDEICCDPGDNCCTDSGAGDAYCCAGGKTCCDKACCDPSTETCCDDIGGDNDGYCCNTGQECCEGECCDPDQTCCDGECCDPNQTCCDGTCCEPPVITSISGPDTVKICEQADFSSSAIDPDGTSLTYSWSGGGCPTTGSSSTFTTKWPCKGDETVSLTITDNDNPECCGSGDCCSDKIDNDSKDVEVTLPSGCFTGTKSAIFGASKTPPTSCDVYTSLCGLTQNPRNFDVLIYARYNNCKWSFEVIAGADVPSGPCPSNYIEITNGNDPDLTQDNYCGIVDVFVNGSGCACVGGAMYSNTDCVTIHEDEHYEQFEEQLIIQYINFLARPSMSDMTIDCSDSTTTTCQAAVTARKRAIINDVLYAYDQAFLGADDEERCREAAGPCFEAIADSICAVWDCNDC